jgi:hypothetical protein
MIFTPDRRPKIILPATFSLSNPGDPVFNNTLLKVGLWHYTRGEAIFGEIFRHPLPPVDHPPEARGPIERKRYFVIHAARQSGKTTLPRAPTREINAKGRQYALYCSLETMREAREAHEAEKGTTSFPSILWTFELLPIRAIKVYG